MKILETDRLILREFELTDAQAIYDLNADPLVMKYTGEDGFNSVDEAHEFLKSYDQYQRNGFGRNAVILKSTNAFIGWCGLKKHSDGMVDLGYRYYQKNWGKGYATESAQAMLDYGFREYALNQIVGRTAEENTASIKVLEKIGMSFWKKGDCGNIAEALYYQISIKEWKGAI